MDLQSDSHVRILYRFDELSLLFDSILFFICFEREEICIEVEFVDYFFDEEIAVIFYDISVFFGNYILFVHLFDYVRKILFIFV